MGKQYLIVGGGIAGLSAAEEIRKSDSTAEITILERGKYLPYLRPLLSKTWMRVFDVEKILVHNCEWYENNRIKVITNSDVNEIDAKGKKVILTTGEVFSYDKLIYAAGSSAFVPPIKGADLEGVFTLRSAENISGLHKCCALSHDAVVIGGGVIGIEIAIELKAMGLNVTILEGMQQLMGRFMDEESSRVLKEKIEAKGINVYTDISVNELSSDEAGRVCAVSFSDNKDKEKNHILDAQLMILSCGIRPQAELLRRAGAECDKGVLTDAYMKTTIKDVYAAGDCISFDGVNPGLWNDSVNSGKIAGLAAYADEESKELPNAFSWRPSEMIIPCHGLFLYVAGIITEDSKLVVGEESKARFMVNKNEYSGCAYKKLFYKDGELVGAILLDTSDELSMIRRKLILGDLEEK